MASVAALHVEAPLSWAATASEVEPTTAPVEGDAAAGSKLAHAPAGAAEADEATKAKTVKYLWSEAHDARLRSLVEELGACKWAELARRMEELRGECEPFRSGKQCRERWYNHLDVAVSKQEW